eukprot:COSAG02_NODE_27_length_51735_cov_86.076749_11_plen_102_part_00
MCGPTFAFLTGLHVEVEQWMTLGAIVATCVATSSYVAEFHSLTRFLWAQTVQSLDLIASLRLEMSQRRCLLRLYYVIVQLKPNSAIFVVDYQPVMGRIDCS